MAATGVQLVTTFDMPTTKTRAGGIYRGNGDPDFTAPKGSLYVKANAAATTDRLWINTDGAATWAYFTASA